jgi:endonuclease-3
MLRRTMARAMRSAVTAASARTLRTSRVKQEGEKSAVKEEDNTPPNPLKNTRKRQSSVKDESPKKRIKAEGESGLLSPSASDEQVSPPSTPNTKKATPKKSTPKDLQARKLKSYARYANASPFPDFLHPTPEECKLAHKILIAMHGARTRPKVLVASTTRAGCGDSPSVLDALVRTILSQNTSDANSTRAKLSMDKAYGRSDKWDAIVQGGAAKLQEAIKSGGLSQIKSKVIISILEQTKEKYGEYSLDHLHDATNDVAMQEMLSFQGVGPKTASCVLLFCLQREDFAVDTHVHRITGLLGWRPKSCSRDETYAHLNIKIPDEDKYGLHSLLIDHGKKCPECRAGGKNVGKCELRKAFRKGKLEGEAGEEVKEEEEEEVKEEEVKEEEEKKMKEEEEEDEEEEVKIEE